MNRFEEHEIATLFPTMSTVDMDHLKESIGKNGQLEEILLFEGKILDGRHRYETCLALGIEPRVREFQGTAQDAFAYSVALNLSRRHLTTVQRAAAGAGIKEFQARLLAGDDGEPAPAEEAAPEIEVAIDEPEGSVDPGDVDPSTEAHAEAEVEAPVEKPKPKKKKPSARTINAKAREIASKRVGVSGRAIETAAKIKEEAPDVFQRMLEGTAGSLPDAKRLTAMPKETREKVHALVDEGKDVKAAMRQVSPPATTEELGPVFLGKVVLEPEQAQTFLEVLEQRGISRADAAREALVDWIGKHAAAGVESASEPVLV